ncbi:MAG: hypothetical protein IPI18_11235 [Saprospiraceae bacterium]|nr:hypothetical protein [Saprospiraceae bacterium]
MKTRIYYILFLAMALAHMNCSKSNNATCAKNFSWQQELSAETSALTQAASAYGQNPRLQTVLLIKLPALII